LTQREKENFDPWDKRQNKLDKGGVLGDRQENLRSPVIQSERKSEIAQISEKRIRSKSRERSRSFEADVSKSLHRKLKRMNKKMCLTEIHPNSKIWFRAVKIGCKLALVTQAWSVPQGCRIRMLIWPTKTLTPTNSNAYRKSKKVSKIRLTRTKRRLLRPTRTKTNFTAYRTPTEALCTSTKKLHAIISHL